MPTGTHLAFLLAAEEAAAEGDEHRPRTAAEPLRDEVRGGCAGRPVVDADVGGPRGAGQVGHQGDDGDAPGGQACHELVDLAGVRRLEDDALRSPAADAVQRLE
jgi:hypothetical protein